MAIGDVSGFKTYEDWQRANRAEGGSGDSAEVRAHYFPPAPTAAPAAPAPAPRPTGGVTGRGSAPAPQPGPAPAPSAPDMSGFQGADGYIRWAQANRAAGGTGDRAAYDQQMGAWQGGGAGGGSGPAGAGAPTSNYGAGGRQSTQATNNAQFENLLAQNRNAGDQYRDPAYSQAQWGAWEEEERKSIDAGKSANQTPNKYNPDGKGCPPDKPFTSAPGPDGKVECASKPGDCPDGSGLHGSKCLGNDWLNANLGGDRPSEASMGANFSGMGGGGGAAGGGGGGAAGGGGSAAGGGDFAQILETNLKKMMGEEGGRYNSQAMQGLLAQIKQRIESSKGNQIRQAQSEAAGRGMSRSGQTGTNLAAIRRGAESQFTQEYGNTLRAKIDADRQDKLDALDRSQKYLDSLRDEMYRRDMSAIQRQQFQANLDLAYANLAQQRQALASSQQHARDMLGAQYGYSAVFGG